MYKIIKIDKHGRTIEVEMYSDEDLIEHLKQIFKNGFHKLIAVINCRK